MRLSHMDPLASRQFKSHGRRSRAELVMNVPRASAREAAECDISWRGVPRDGYALWCRAASSLMRHKHTHTHTHTRTHAANAESPSSQLPDATQTHTHARAHAHTDTDTHTHIQTYTHTHTYTRCVVKRPAP